MSCKQKIGESLAHGPEPHCLRALRLPLRLFQGKQERRPGFWHFHGPVAHSCGFIGLGGFPDRAEPNQDCSGDREMRWLQGSLWRE